MLPNITVLIFFAALLSLVGFLSCLVSRYVFVGEVVSVKAAIRRCLNALGAFLLICAVGVATMAGTIAFGMDKFWF